RTGQHTCAMNVGTNTPVRRSDASKVQFDFRFCHRVLALRVGTMAHAFNNSEISNQSGSQLSTINHQPLCRDPVAAAVDCGRQLLVMVLKFSSPARTETSLTIPTVR